MYVTPTEEEIFKVRCHCHLLASRAVPHTHQRYNPELQKKALARREQTQQEFEDFTRQLKEAARSDKPSKHSDTLTPQLSRNVYFKTMC